MNENKKHPRLQRKSRLKQSYLPDEETKIKRKKNKPVKPKNIQAPSTSGEPTLKYRKIETEHLCTIEVIEQPETTFLKDLFATIGGGDGTRRTYDSFLDTDKAFKGKFSEYHVSEDEDEEEEFLTESDEDLDDELVVTPAQNENSNTEVTTKRIDNIGSPRVEETVTASLASYEVSLMVPEEQSDNYSVHKVDNSYVVLLDYDTSIQILGLCTVAVLYGKIDILGYKISASPKVYKVYSLKGTALLSITNNNEPSNLRGLIKNLLSADNSQFRLGDALGNIKIRKDSVILKISALKEYNLIFMQKHLTESIFPSTNSDVELKIEPEGEWNTLTVSDDWIGICDEVTGSSRLMVCGGKGVGKSTFIRYAINSLLGRFERVRVIDLDPGQSEFCVPATISIHSVTEPVLGPNYTHLQKPLSCILSNVNGGLDPNRYVQCVEALLALENEKNHGIPVLINFMGFTNDVGHRILSAAVAVVQPTKLVIIDSSSKSKNYDTPITYEYMQMQAFMIDKNLMLDPEFEVVTILSQTEESGGFVLTARHVREMCISSYFGQLLDKEQESILDHRLSMFSIDLNTIKITNEYNEPTIEGCTKANIVALCSLLNENDNIFHCFGWGIVRCVDEARKKLVIVTPEKEAVLIHVSHVIVGLLTLPPSLYMTLTNLTSDVPYVSQGQPFQFSQLTRRVYIPPFKK